MFFSEVRDPLSADMPAATFLGVSSDIRMEMIAMTHAAATDAAYGSIFRYKGTGCGAFCASFRGMGESAEDMDPQVLTGGTASKR